MKKIVITILVLFIFSSSEAKNSESSLASFYIEGKIEKAIRLCENKINELEHDDVYRLNLALLYEEKGELDKSIEELEKIPPSERKNEVIYHLARLYCLTSHNKKSISLFEDYISGNSSDSRAFFYQGLNYEDLKQESVALDYYKRALKQDRYFVLPIIRTAEIYFGEGEFKEAVRYLQMVKRFDPSIKLSYRKLAFAFFYESDYLSSFKEASKYLSMEKDDKKVQMVLRWSREELGDEFFKRERKKKIKVRKEKEIKVSHFAEGENIPEINILVDNFIKAFYIKPLQDSLVFVSDKPRLLLSNRKIYKFQKAAEESVDILTEGNKIGSVDCKTPFLIKGQKDKSVFGVFGLKQKAMSYRTPAMDKFFRGKFKIIASDNRMKVINIVNLEEYLYSVIPSEVFASWPSDSLKAQAVVARTKAVKSLKRVSGKEYNLGNNVFSQVYEGVEREKKATTRAVDQTQGIVLAENKELTDIFYSSNCGGHTQSYKSVKGVKDGAFKESFSFPFTPLRLYRWLKNEPDAFCKLGGKYKSRFRWQRIYRPDMLIREVKEYYPNFERLEFFNVLSRNLSGHAEMMDLGGAGQKESIKSEFRIRRVLDNLRSGLFRIETKYDRSGRPEYFIFWGGGFGHGKGLCQYGAKGMAEKGYSYREILEHYFSDSRLVRVY